MKGRNGVAALFDAIFFIAAISIISAGLLTALQYTNDTIERTEMERVKAAHVVLLRSTLPDRANNSYTVEQSFCHGTYDQIMMASNISEILDLLLPGMKWRWHVEVMGEQFRLGEERADSETTFCSVVRAPIKGGEIIFKLEAWSA